LCEADPVIAGIPLDVSVPPGPWLDADPDLMAQVCLNLLRKAATATRGASDTPQIGFTVQEMTQGGGRIEVSDMAWEFTPIAANM